MWSQLITFLSLLLFPLNGIAATVKVFVFTFVFVFVFTLYMYMYPKCRWLKKEGLS